MKCLNLSHCYNSHHFSIETASTILEPGNKRGSLPVVGAPFLLTLLTNTSYSCTRGLEQTTYMSVKVGVLVFKCCTCTELRLLLCCFWSLEICWISLLPLWASEGGGERKHTIQRYKNQETPLTIMLPHQLREALKVHLKCLTGSLTDLSSSSRDTESLLQDWHTPLLETCRWLDSILITEPRFYCICFFSFTVWLKSLRFCCLSVINMFYLNIIRTWII